MPGWTNLPPHILAENPEVADLLRRSKGRARLKNEPKKMAVNLAPAFLSYWKLSGDHFFPDPESECKFYPGRDWAYDWGWPRYKVSVEIDGGQHEYGGGRHATDSDRAKLNAGSSLGWIIFRFSPEQLENDPAGCVNLVVKALELRASSLHD